MLYLSWGIIAQWPKVQKVFPSKWINKVEFFLYVLLLISTKKQFDKMYIFLRNENRYIDNTLIIPAFGDFIDTQCPLLHCFFYKSYREA